MNREKALSEIQQTAEKILKESREPVVRVRLLRDILRKPDNDPELLEARKLVAGTKLGKRLEEELQAGAFTKALNTAMDLGLPENHSAVTQVKRYAESYLSEGVLNVSTRLDRSITGIDLSVFERDLASTLARVDRKSPLVEEIFEKWATIAGVAFDSGRYNREQQMRVTRAIFNPDYGLRHALHYPEAVLADASVLLAARIDLLDPEIDRAYIKWYVLESHRLVAESSKLLDTSCRASSKCLSAAGILLDVMRLYGFRSWRSDVEAVVDCFWQVRHEDGFWNFGATCMDPSFLSNIRLADNWRGKRCAHDWTTRVLLLLQKYYEGDSK